MTTARHLPVQGVPSSRPSIHVVRARKLLFAGLAGGLAAAGCLVLFWLIDGRRGLISAALGAGLTLFFYLVGQVVMVLFADAGARTLLVASLASYTGRVTALGLVLLSYSRHRDAWPQLLPIAVFVSTIAVVAGWLLLEVFVFSRLRIGVYDTEYTTPSGGDSAS